MTAKTDMLKGEWYDANFDTELLRERIFVKDLCLEFNNTKMADDKARRDILRKILPRVLKITVPKL